MPRRSLALPYPKRIRELPMLDSARMKRRLVGAILFAALCTAIATFMAPKTPSGARQRVRSDVPAEFPVAVRDAGTAATKFYRYAELPNSTQQKDRSFLIGEPIPAGIAVEASSEGKQSLRVERPIDRNTTAIGWYHATEKEVFPQFFELRKEYRDRQKMLTYGGIAFSISAVLAALFSMGWLWQREPQ